MRAVATGIVLFFGCHVKSRQWHAILRLNKLRV